MSETYGKAESITDCLPGLWSLLQKDKLDRLAVEIKYASSVDLNASIVVKTLDFEMHQYCVRIQYAVIAYLYFYISTL
ncbi:hypothetical protein T4D_12286 [Trichinella pseudospiralis]|uniref:Uncharacterized protein n=1 Tax=Trichinella pseudospiralis TaxID=6337 RepID=A0A0V1G5N8_TRIPS|nr:hypothetical protein T4D_12286 [Trichinella pseudospiralis]